MVQPPGGNDAPFFRDLVWRNVNRTRAMPAFDIFRRRQPYRGLAQSLRHRHKAAGFVQVVHRAPGVTFILRRRAFQGEGVAVPAEQGEAAVQLALALCSLKLVPASTGFRFVPVMRRRVLVQPTPKGVIAVLVLELVVLGSVRKALILGDAALKTTSECSFTTRKLRFLGCFRLA